MRRFENCSAIISSERVSRSSASRTGTRRCGVRAPPPICSFSTWGCPESTATMWYERLRREERNVPIIVLTGRCDEIDRVLGFELGADDFVSKPFSPREVVARIKSILRRCGRAVAQPAPVLRFGRLEIDAGAREARVDGIDVKLKPREFALLMELAGNAGVALSRDWLLQRVWGFDFNGDERTIDVHVHRLRAKIEEPWKLPSLLRTVHGFGYKFVRG